MNAVHPLPTCLPTYLDTQTNKAFIFSIQWVIDCDVEHNEFLLRGAFRTMKTQFSLLQSSTQIKRFSLRTDNQSLEWRSEPSLLLISHHNISFNRSNRKRSLLSLSLRVSYQPVVICSFVLSISVLFATVPSNVKYFSLFRRAFTICGKTNGPSTSL